MTPERKKELQVKIFKMKEAQVSFYMSARQIGVHPFLEIAGFMAEQIKMYQGMFEAGIDFTENAIQGRPTELAYIAEKFDCIFGPALTDKPNRQAFLASLAKKGGWELSS